MLSVVLTFYIIYGMVIVLVFVFTSVSCLSLLFRGFVIMIFNAMGCCKFITLVDNDDLGLD